MAWRALSAYCKWWAREYQVANPLERLEKPKEPDPKRTTVAEADAVDRLLNSIGDDDPTGLRDRASILVLASSGMRRSEVVRMQRKDVDLVECTIFVVGVSSR
jgi:integrase/recombinase XerD